MTATTVARAKLRNLRRSLLRLVILVAGMGNTLRPRAIIELCGRFSKL